MKIGEVSRESGQMPESLLAATPVVKKLWYVGEWEPAIFKKCVAIVGSRRMSRYGKQVIAEIVPRLVLSGYTIVSGLMYGVDQEAHKATLANGGRAIGVLGWGIDYDCEEGAEKLIGQIVETGGVIMSEYAPLSVSQNWMFPQRNRIVAALSEMVIIVEAAERSGTMSTAKWAKKFGKKIYAAPGSMFSDTSSGANMLIASGEATLLTMKEVMKWGGQTQCQSATVSRIHGELLMLLKVEGPMSVNEVVRKTGRGVGEVSAELLQAELSGAAIEERGVWKVV